MKKLNLKKVTFLACLMLLFANANFASAAAEAAGGKQLTPTSSSGIINVVDADTINGFAVGVNFTTDFTGAGSFMMINGAFGFLHQLEIGGGADIGFDGQAVGGIMSLKWNFWGNDKVKLAFMGDVQFNTWEWGGGMDVDGQLLFVASWKIGNFETSATFGKTMGTHSGDPNSATNWQNWDFGMGGQWWFYNGKGFSMCWAFDFANYDYRDRGAASDAAGNGDYRGNFSTVLRFGFLNKMLLLDVGGVDLLDSGRAFEANLSFNMNF